MKVSKNVKIAAIVAVSLLILFFVFRGNLTRKYVESTGALDIKPGDMNKNKLLKKGSKGAEVAELQRLLKKSGQGQLLGATGPNNDGVDGFFGSKTEAALVAAKAVKQITLADFSKTNSPATASAGASVGDKAPNGIAYESPFMRN